MARDALPSEGGQNFVPGAAALTAPSQTAAFFGVYALAGVATAWLAPTLVNICTRVTHSQQGGFATIIGLLALGLAGLLFVRGGGRDAAPAG